MIAPAQARPQVLTPNERANALTGRPYITYSEISAFQACPLKHYFQYVEHAEPEQLSAAMLLGTCVHAAVEHHLQLIMAADEAPPLDGLMDVYRQTWQVEAGSKPIQFARDDDAATLETTARQMLDAFLNSAFAKPEGEIIGIEETLTTTLATDLPDLVGRVDVLSRHGGELIITDFKTTRSMWSPETAEEHAQQLVLYGLGAQGIAQDLRTRIRLQFIVLTKAKAPKIEARTVLMNQDRIQRTITTARRVFRALQAGHVYPSPSPMNCSTCPFQLRCERWHRTVEML